MCVDLDIRARSNKKETFHSTAASSVHSFYWIHSLALAVVLELNFKFAPAATACAFVNCLSSVVGCRHALGCSWRGDRRSHDDRIVYERNWKLSTIIDGTEFRSLFGSKVRLPTNPNVHFVIGIATSSRWSRCEWHRCNTARDVVQKGQQCRATDIRVATDLIDFGQFQQQSEFISCNEGVN